MTASLNSIEKKSIVALSAIYGLRMFGLFLILPVLAIYAQDLSGATPLLMGLALGIYGISQAVFQIPFGMMSDRFGRKPIIYIGLSLFIVGSLVAAFSETIMGVIVGRALQGSGAIAAVVLAMTSDLTRENQRTKAMAFIGMSIGLAFMLALILAPIFEFWIGVQGLFILTAILAAMAIMLVYWVVPTPIQCRDYDVRPMPSKMLALLKHPHLLRLDFGIFALHLVLMAMFVVLPIKMVEQLGLEVGSHWRIYIPSLLTSILFMVPMIILSTNQKRTMPIFKISIAILVLAQLAFLVFSNSQMGLLVCVTLFFIGFNSLEAMLPSLVSRVAPAGAKGSAMGIYNTCQFMGIFLGGLMGGFLYGKFGVLAVFVACCLVLLVWFWFAMRAPEYRLLDSMAVRFANNQSDVCQTELRGVKGVVEVTVIGEQKVAYLKVDKAILDRQALDDVIAKIGA